MQTAAQAGSKIKNFRRPGYRTQYTRSGFSQLKMIIQRLKVHCAMSHLFVGPAK